MWDVPQLDTDIRSVQIKKQASNVLHHTINNKKDNCVIIDIHVGYACSQNKNQIIVISGARRHATSFRFLKTFKIGYRFGKKSNSNRRYWCRSRSAQCSPSVPGRPLCTSCLRSRSSALAIVAVSYVNISWGCSPMCPVPPKCTEATYRKQYKIHWHSPAMSAGNDEIALDRQTMQLSASARCK